MGIVGFVAKDLIFVTGGTGFLGHHLVPRLLKEQYRVRLLVRPTSDVSWLSDAQVEYWKGDVTDFRSISKGIRNCQYVVHAAGFFRFWGSDAKFRRVNIEGTANVAKAAIEEGVDRFVHISTVAVVGEPPPGRPIDETTPCHPQDAYQRSKYAGEQQVMALIFNAGLPAVILRPGAFYGPYGLYGFNRLFIEDPMRGFRIRVDQGKRLVFPVYVPDVARTICQVLQCDGFGEIYNICDQPVTHNKINHLVSNLLGISHWRLNVPRRLMIGIAGIMEWLASMTGQEPFYPLNLRHYVFNDWPVSSAKAHLDLDFTATPLEEGLRRTVDWYRGR